MTENQQQELQRLMSQRGVLTPQFPGDPSGNMIDLVREWIRNQKRVKGFEKDIAIGTAGNQLNIDLSGTAKLLLGFALKLNTTDATQNEDTKVTVTVNNEIVIDSLAVVFLSPEFMDDEYYYFPRPLAGTDTIIASFEADAANTVQVAAYYI